MSDASVTKKPEMVKPVVGRGPAYPFISLERAMERVEAIREANMARTSVAPGTYYRLWGYGGESGASRQTLAALNHYGLVEYVGRGDNRQVRLAELALRIIFDRVPNSAARTAAIQEAALNPAIHRKLMDRYGLPVPPDFELETFLMRDSDYSEEAAQKVIGIYRDTLRYASLDQPDNMPAKALSKEPDATELNEVNVGDLVQVEIEGALALPRPARVRAIQEHDGRSWVFIEGSETGVPMEQIVVEQKGASGALPPSPVAPRLPELRPPEERPPAEAVSGTRREVFALDEGDLVINYPEDLSLASYEDLETYLQLFLRKAKRKAAEKQAKYDLDGTPPEERY